MARWTAAITLMLCACSSIEAQITPPRKLSAGDRFVTLEEQLTNRLKATRQDQQDYIRFVVEQCRQQRLEMRLIVGVERWAIRRYPSFPFPYFERALRFEAGKRGVALPTVRQVASTRAPEPRPPLR